MSKTYRLGSNGLVHAPGVIAWAIAGYRWKKDRPLVIEAVATCWSIPEEAVIALLSRKVEHTVEGEAVVFAYPPVAK